MSDRPGRREAARLRHYTCLCPSGLADAFSASGWQTPARANAYQRTFKTLPHRLPRWPRRAKSPCVIAITEIRFCPLLAHSGHCAIEFQCPLLGVKRTWGNRIFHKAAPGLAAGLRWGDHSVHRLALGSRWGPWRARYRSRPITTGPVARPTLYNHGARHTTAHLL